MKNIKQDFSAKTIFVTGASGVVGQPLLERLSNHTVICLAHRTPILATNIISLPGDITKPQFGLSHAEFGDLVQRIDCVVHAAAITDFTQAEEVIFRTNVDGIQNVLELASAAQAPLFHISTAFVHPSRHTVDDSDLSAYVLSKRDGERTVRESGLPHTIVRPSIVVGDSKTGAMKRFQGLHFMSGLLLKSSLPIIPVSPQYYLDFVPQDVVVNVIAELINRDHVGGEWWLTAGEQALTVRKIIDFCVDHSQYLIGSPVAHPRIVNPDVFERLIRPVFLPTLPRHLQRIMIRALQLCKNCLEQSLPTSLPGLARSLNLAPLPSLQQTLLHNLEYWATVNGYHVEKGALERVRASQPRSLTA